MAADVEELLAPVSDDNPVGDDLSYDAERQTIELAFESSLSDDDGEEEQTDWRQIIGLIEGQSARTKDIWLAIYLARAGARSGRLEVVETAAQYLAGLLERYWPSVHPQLDEYGFQGRKGPCESLTRIGEFLGPLKRMILLRHPRLGQFSGVDFTRFADNGPNEDGYGLFRAALEDVGAEGLGEILAAIDRIRDGIRRADTVLTTEANGETGTNFATTYEAIDAIRRGVAAFAPGQSGDAGESTPDAGGGASAAPSSGGGAPAASFGGRIDSREDVLKAIDAIIEYYQRREPASPLPALMVRARGWVGTDFLTILRDIAPDSLSDVRRVLVSQLSDDD